MKAMLRVLLVVGSLGFALQQRHEAGEVREELAASEAYSEHLAKSLRECEAR